MAFDPKIGLRLKKRRRKMGMSLRELARHTDLTASFLSQVERGQTNISLDSLRKLGEALNVSFLYFLSEQQENGEGPTPSEEESNSVEQEAKDEEETRPSYSPVVRAEDRARLIFPDTGVSYELLTPSLAYQMEVICGRMNRGTDNVVRPLREPTEEFIYVLSGSLLVGLEDEEYVLNPGDTIYFKGSSLRTLAAASDEEAVWISVITPPVF